jgi:hypothetical protein
MHDRGFHCQRNGLSYSESVCLNGFVMIGRNSRLGGRRDHDHNARDNKDELDNMKAPFVQEGTDFLTKHDAAK